MNGQEKQNTAIKNRPRLSIKLLTLIPIFVLSFVCILSNIVAVHNIQNVNRTATTIADDYMTGIFNLSNIQRETQKLHTMALSHIIATDLDTMVELVDSIRTEEASSPCSVTVPPARTRPPSSWQTVRSHSTQRISRMLSQS